MICARDQPVALDGALDERLEPGLDDRALAAAYEVDLDGVGIDADDAMPIACEARSGHHTHIT